MRSSLIFLIIALAGGSAFILMKYAVLVFTPIEIAIYRLVGGAVFLGFIWLTRDGVPGIPRRQWPSLAMISIAGIGLPFTLQPWLIHQTQNSGFIGMIQVFVPLMTLLVSIPLLGAWPNWREVTGVLVGLAALLIVKLDGSARDFPLYVLSLALLVPLLYAVLNTLMRRLFNDIDRIPLTFGLLAVAAIGLMPFAPLQERAVGSGSLGHAIAAVLVLGVVSTGLSTYLFFTLVQRHGPLHAGLAAYLIPAVALGWSWLLNEQITLKQGVGLATALLMVWLVRSGHAHPRERTHSGPVETEPET